MNHNLRVLVRVDLDPGHVTLEVTGCLTPANFPVHHELGVAAASALEDADDFRLTLLEPDELPVCHIHRGETDAEPALAGVPFAGNISPLSFPGGRLAGLVEAGSAR